MNPEQTADEYKAWLCDGEDGSPYLRAVDWLHAVLPNMENAIVTVLEGPWAGRTVQVPARHVIHDFSRLPEPEPEPAAREAGGRHEPGQMVFWG